MNKLNELLNELNQIMRDNNDLNNKETRQYILALIEQLQNEAMED